MSAITPDVLEQQRALTNREHGVGWTKIAPARPHPIVEALRTLELPPKPLVYVAGPYTSDPVAGTRAAVHAAEQAERLGAAVVIPHLSLLWDCISHAPADRWYERDLYLLARCDAVLRLPGSSEGADREVRFARGRGIPVFHAGGDLSDLGDWIASWR